MIVLIDNYDSFTYNVYQYLCELTKEEVRVFRNDRITVEDLEVLSPGSIVISPGPGRPEDAGVSMEVIRTFAGRVPILGVCLGHQAIGAAFGGHIIAAKHIVHGKAQEIRLDGKGLFRNLPSSATFTRYHSLVVDPDSVPTELEITAWSGDGEIMGLRHRTHTVEGVQFHPESIASDQGKKLLASFLNYRREPFPFKETMGAMLGRRHLSRAQAEEFMDELTDGNLSEAKIAAYLTALAAKGVSPEEIAGCASVLQRKRTKLTAAQPAIDTCGTGGDGLGTFNISSMAALAAAACGVTVAKHGNRAVSSKSGSADFFRELGMAIDLPPDKAARLLDSTGFAFLFAPIYHQAMKHAGPVRRELGMKTIMNLLGPLANPAGARAQLIGVYDGDLCLPMAQAAKMLGLERVMVVHGEDGLDEISVSGPTKAVFIDENDELTEMSLTPEELGIRRSPGVELVGGAPDENARLARRLLEGGGPGAVRDAVLVNAGAALFVAGAAESAAAGCEAARDAFERGAVKQKLDDVVARSRELAAAASVEA